MTDEEFVIVSRAKEGGMFDDVRKAYEENTDSSEEEFEAFREGARRVAALLGREIVLDDAVKFLWLVTRHGRVERGDLYDFSFFFENRIERALTLESSTDLPKRETKASRSAE